MKFNQTELQELGKLINSSKPTNSLQYISIAADVLVGHESSYVLRIMRDQQILESLQNDPRKITVDSILKMDNSFDTHCAIGLALFLLQFVSEKELLKMSDVKGLHWYAANNKGKRTISTKKRKKSTKSNTSSSSVKSTLNKKRRNHFNIKTRMKKEIKLFGDIFTDIGDWLTK